jgi:hypothetical protein
MTSMRDEVDAPFDSCAQNPRSNASDPGACRLPEWLGEEVGDVPRLKALLCPYPAEEMACWPVSTT